MCGEELSSKWYVNIHAFILVSDIRIRLILIKKEYRIVI
jgi:hypothetical protein